MYPSEINNKKYNEFENQQNNFFIKGVNAYIQKNLPVTRVECRVLYRLLGFLLTKTKPFTYSNNKLAKLEMYSIRSIQRALDRLEQLELIKRIGNSYRRKFTLGTRLIEICDCVKNNLNSTLIENKTHATISTKNTQVKNKSYMTKVHETMSNCLDAMPMEHIIKDENNNKINYVAAVDKVDSVPFETSLTPITAYETKLKEAYRNHVKFINDSSITNEDDFIAYCEWSINHDRPQDVRIAGRIKSIINFLEQGTLEISSKWKQKKHCSQMQSQNAYQEYVGRIKHDIFLKLIPSDTKIATYEEFVSSEKLN